MEKKKEKVVTGKNLLQKAQERLEKDFEDRKISMIAGLLNQRDDLMFTLKAVDEKIKKIESAKVFGELPVERGERPF